MHIKKRCLSVSVSTAVAAILACHAPGAAATEVPRFVIPAQPLGDALRAVGTQSNLNIVFDARLVDGKLAPSIDARLSPEQVVTRLLDGTGIRHRFLDESTLILTAGPGAGDTASMREASSAPLIRLAQADPSQQADALQAQAGAPQAANAAKPQDALEEVVVRGLVFKSDEVETANKMGLSVKETPQSVRIVTQDMLEFSHVTKFEDAYKLDAGAHTSHSQDQFVRGYLRGFQLDAPKVDGFRMSNYPTLDLAPFERFEIIKGATSTVYGQSPVAGTVNAVSKKPLRDDGGKVSLEGGNYGHYRAEADFHGSLSDKLSYRLIGAYLDEDSFLDLAYNRRTVVAPSLKLDFTDDTSLTLMLQYQDAEFLSSYGFGPQFIGGDFEDPRNYVIPRVPRSRIAVKPDGRSDREFLLTRAYLEHHFESGWTLRANLQNTRVDVLNKGSYAFSSDELGNAIVYMYLRDAEDQFFSGEVNLFGNVEAFGREHTLFLGFDHSRDSGVQLSGFGNAVDPAFPGFNLFDPDYSVFLPFPDSAAGYPGIANIRDLTEEYGITGQALLRVTDDLGFMLGTRYSHVEIGSLYTQDVAPLPHTIGSENRYTNTAWTFQGGITYALTPSTNVYGNYGETFTPRGDLLADGSTAGPEEGVAYEIGVKGELFDQGRLMWSLAAFDIERTNIAQPIPNTVFVALLGKQRSRGLELDFQGEVVPGWDVYGSAAYLENEFVDGEFKGFASYLAPKFGVSLYSSYEFQEGRWRGLGLGGGVVYKKRGHFPTFDGYPVASQPGALVYFDHLFEDPLEVDLRAFYRHERWTLEISGTNVFGDKYYSPVENTLSYGLGVNPGRQVIGKLSYEF